jgi:hypothetical protein
LTVVGTSGSVVFTIESTNTTLDFQPGSRFGTLSPGFTTIDPNGSNPQGLGVWDLFVVNGGCAIGSAYAQTTPPSNGLIVAGYVNHASTYKYNMFYAPPNWSYSTSTINQWVSIWSFSFSLSVASYVDVGVSGHWINSAAGNNVYIGIGVDGNAPADTPSYFDNYTLGSVSTYGPGIGSTFFDTCANSSWWQGYTHTTRVKLAAGSHTAALRCWGYGGTYTFNGGGMSLLVIPVNYL